MGIGQGTYGNNIRNVNIIIIDILPIVQFEILTIRSV